jgi:serine/threonine-protein kinase
MPRAPAAWVTSTIELVSPIAEGAMGSVWVAYHHRLQTRVAVKFVSDKLGEDSVEALARFEREASTASQIKSAHVVQTFDSGISTDGEPFMVMELLDGESLGDRLRRARHVSLEEAATILTQVARALTKAHHLGIVHRDIKPDNIFLCRGDDGLFCKVLDFGIAKQTRLPSMGGLTTEGTMVGTPEYLSPEQVLEGARVDYRADLWALAIVIYVSLTGTLPFAGRTVGQLCLALATAKHRPPSELRPNLALSIDRWFQRALHRNPNKRFGSAHDMALGFLRAMPEDAAAGVNLGVGTALNVEDTERNFGTTTDATLPRIRAPRFRLIGAVVALFVLGLGVGGVVFANLRASEQTRAAALGLGLTEGARAIAERLTEDEDASPVVVDLDGEQSDVQPAPRTTGRSVPVAKPLRPAARPPKPLAKAEPEDEPEEPPSPPPPAPAPKGQKIRSTPELGF